MSEVRYNIYPTLLDSWTYYRESEMTEEAFLDRINGKGPPSEAVLAGSAFNGVVDRLCAGNPLQKVSMTDGGEGYRGKAADEQGTDHFFVFHAPLVERFVGLYKDALRQQFLEFEADTAAGRVRFYGYADGVFPDGIRDIKTTSRYKAFKYRRKWQPYVYLHALRAMGGDPSYFAFDVTDFRDIWTEYYRSADYPLGDLLAETAALCRWLSAHEGRITKRKIFNENQ